MLGIGKNTPEGGVTIGKYETLALAEGAVAEGAGLIASNKTVLGISIATLNLTIASISGNSFTTSKNSGLKTIFDNIEAPNGFVLKITKQNNGGTVLIPVNSPSSGDIQGNILTGYYATLTALTSLDSLIAQGDTISDLYLGAVIKEYGHHEGNKNIVAGKSAHAEGEFNIALGLNSHVEGYSTSAKGDAAHAEGTGTVANGNYSHAEGEHTQAIA